MSSILYSPLTDYIPAFKAITLSPLLALPPFLTLKYAPETFSNVLAQVAEKLPPALLSSSAFSWLNNPGSDTLRIALTAWAAASIIRQVNGFLNTMATNSWRMGVAPGWDWPKEIAVVTGGSSGIGKDLVERLAKLGIRTAIFDVNPPPKGFENDKIRYYKCDVTDSASIAAAADAIRKDWGHPTILVNNAGLTKPMPILKLPESFLRKIFGVNAMALWLTTQQFLPRMIQTNKGHIITVASAASFIALTCGADYSATKAAALSFHESLACEIRHYYKATNILTSVVHPNFVRTPLVQDFAHSLEKSGVRMITADQVADGIVSRIKSRRGGQLVIPESVGIVSGIRGWPNWLQEVLRDIIGKAAADADF